MTSNPAGPIIDTHLLAFPHPSLGGVAAPYYPDDDEHPSGIKSAASTAECLSRTLEQMDRYNIVKGFLGGDLKTLREWKKAAPSRFIAAPILAVGPVGLPHVSELRREFEDGLLGGIGEIGAQYQGIAPNDPALEPYFALAEEMDVPVLIHTLGFGARRPAFRVAAGNPLLLEDVLVRHPGMRIYLENAGFPFFGEVVAMMYQYRQLHADLSTISWIIPREAFHDYLKRLMDAGLGKRLMFGSDQMVWPEVIGEAVDGVNSASFLSEEEKRDIFYNNAARFLRIS